MILRLEDYNHKVNWKGWANEALDWFYPRRCCLCAQIGPEALCSYCLASFTPPAEPVRSWGAGSPLAMSYSLFAYDDRAAQAVRRLKYSRILGLVEPMSRQLREFYDELELAPSLIVPVPIHPSRLRMRGFNQAELLCSNLSKDLIKADLLIRTKKTKPQVELSPAQRLTELRGAFATDRPLKGENILLVDDVITTGGTALACAETLRKAGATEVSVLTYCGEKPDSLLQA